MCARTLRAVKYIFLIPLHPLHFAALDFTHLYNSNTYKTTKMVMESATAAVIWLGAAPLPIHSLLERVVETVKNVCVQYQNALTLLDG